MIPSRKHPPFKKCQCIIIFHSLHLTFFPYIFSKPVEEIAIDVSRGAQIRDIEATFAEADDSFDLTTIKHPHKPRITAVASYDILPDSEIWANAYDLFKFSERPGERNIEVISF